MFSGEESIRVKGNAPRSQVYDQIEDALFALGDAEVDKRGNIDIIPKSSLSNFLSETTIEGSVRERGGQYIITVEYKCSLNAMGWVILVLGILLFLVGVLVLLAPMFAKDNVSQAVRKALRAME